MSESTTDTSPAGVGPTTTHEPSPGHQVIVERRVVHDETPERVPEKRSFVLPFVAGFVTAIVAGAFGAAIFLAVSDSDDDGEIELDVPAVDLEVGG